MINPITDRLRLIEEKTFDGLPIFGKIAIPLLDQVVPVIEGKNQEIFRHGIHIGSVYSYNALNASNPNPVKARSGDVIYLVSRLPQPYTFAGTIMTSDGYQRMYEMSIELKISNSICFVQQCRQSRDPAGRLIQRFKGKFEDDLSNFDHDKIDSVKPVFDKLNSWFSDYTGVRIVNPTWIFRADYKREKALEIRQNTDLKKKELEAENEIRDHEEQYRMERERKQRAFEREEKEKQKDFERLEKIKSNLNEARIKLLNMTVNDLITINSERMRDAFDCNRSARTVLEDSLKLLSVFSVASSEEESIIESTSTLLHNDLSLDASIEEDGGPKTTIHTP